MHIQYLYLTLNILTFIVPFVFSFYPRADFSRQWKFVLPAMMITAGLFVAWDEWFTRMGVWGFNTGYLTGFYIFSLPVEEVLFFFCIPYACVFTHFALNHLVRKDYMASIHRWITVAVIVALVVTGWMNIHRWYTAVAFLLTAFFFYLVGLRLKAELMSGFYRSFLILLIPFFAVDGILTGSFLDEPVVWYNNDETLGIRIATIPVEDVVYCALLLLMNISIAALLEQHYGTRQKRKSMGKPGIPGCKNTSTANAR